MTLSLRIGRTCFILAVVGLVIALCRLWPGADAQPSGPMPSPSASTVVVSGAIPVHPQAKVQPGLDTASLELQLLTIQPRSAGDLPALERLVSDLGGVVAERVDVKSGRPRMRVRLPGRAIESLATFPEVGWIERFVPRRLLNDVAVGSALMNVETVRKNHGLTGRGQVVTTSDSGIDTGNRETLHADLRTNVIGFELADDGVYDCDRNGHGTHTAGSIVGTGAMSDGQIRGVAYEAKLWAWFCEGSEYLSIPADCEDLFRPPALGPTNAYIHSASWGGDTNVYNTDTQAIDMWCWENPDFLPVFAAGNDGKAYTISSESAAKNVLCVGATESLRPNKGVNASNPAELAYFSSRGPLPDGRVKPDVCAPGTYIVSTRSRRSSSTAFGVYSNTNYLYNSGTSMATPLVAGTMALVRQWLVEQAGFTNRAPSAALMKAVITGGATRLGDAAPDTGFGWGRVDLGESIFPTNGLGVVLRDYLDFGPGVSCAFSVTTTNSAPLDVQLCWIDYPAEPATAGAKSLVVDLDLIVSNLLTGATYTPDDHVNNLESVHLDLADPGTYAVIVRSYDTANLSSASGGAAAVYLRGAVDDSDQDEDLGLYASVTVIAEGGGDGWCSPGVGTHRYLKGETVDFSAGKYPDDEGADYRYSGNWNLDLERYPLLGWRLDDGSEVREGVGDAVSVTVTNDLTLVWRWTNEASHVTLLLRSYADYLDTEMYPDAKIGRYYHIPYGETVVVEPCDAPILGRYPSPDDGWTVQVDDDILVWNGESVSWHSFGTLKLTSFCVIDENGNYAYTNGWNASDRFRLADSVPLEMDKFAVVDFGYADVDDEIEEFSLPFWWWERNFAGALQNGLLTEGESSATGDPDGDGFDNRAECHEPTDPWNLDSFPFRFTGFSSLGFVFIGSTNGSFRIETKSSLSEGESWSNCWQSASSRSSVTNRVEFSTTDGSSRYYRAVYEPEGER